MNLGFKLELPKSGEAGTVSVKNIKNKPYVYLQHGCEYKTERRHSVPKTTCIGKRCDDDETMFWPNANFLKFFPDAKLPTQEMNRSSCLHVGNFLVLEQIMNGYGLDTMLKDVIDDKPGLFLNLIAYSIITENNAGQYYPDYTYSHPLFTPDMHQYSDATICRFLNGLTVEQSAAFLNEWNAARDHRERIYISYDSTNKICQAGDIDMIEPGHAKTGITQPILNFACAWDRDNREPLFYEAYPGSIVDVSQLQCAIDKAHAYGYRNVGFILDRGYFSQSNIHYLDRNGYQFIIMVKGMKPLVNGLVATRKGTFEDKHECTIRAFKTSCTTVKQRLYPSDKKDRYFHIYFSSRKYANEKEKLEDKIYRLSQYLQKQEGKAVRIGKEYSKYFELVYYHEGQEDEHFMYAREKNDVINREIGLCGYFVIITSEKMTAREALILYKSRDGSEKLFRGDKSYLGHRSLRVQTNESADGKLFIEFIAMIVRNKFYTSLQDEMSKMEKRLNYMTVPAAVRELEKIEIIRQMDGRYRLDHAITATQAAILKAFGLEPSDIKTSIKVLSQKLADLETAA